MCVFVCCLWCVVPGRYQDEFERSEDKGRRRKRFVSVVYNNNKRYLAIRGARGRCFGYDVLLLLRVVLLLLLVLLYTIFDSAETDASTHARR